MAETAIVLPLLVLIINGAINFARVLDRYVDLTRIAYEGARVGSDIKDLSEGLTVNLPPPQGLPESEVTVAHILQHRIRVVASHAISDESALDISTELVRDSLRGNHLKVRISQDFPLLGWIPLFGSSRRISGEVTIPYLFL